ncbi:sulfotransferase 2B1-like [Protopterus annectens]|uniref:sulfotransferase 2B1-like n=1 Tax=Protopterus annectens TaxID=7888 RepID=UPI001CFBDD7A|nr:sulfotransferase 2B1-like [Protopterus annectens]XP_043937382.1 sulfotransferase 2B1-like [Protopterus annectens]
MSDHYMLHDGILFPKMVHDDISLNYATNEFQVRDDDVFNVTYPKCGTVWMQEILTLIKSNGDTEAFLTIPNWDRVPWIEQMTAKQLLENQPSPRLITTHLPAHLAPKSLYNSKAKVIYTTRNPRDACISLYHFCTSISFLETPKNLDDFVQKFLKGEVMFGSWFDHLKGWLGVKHKVEIMFQTYEDLLKDPRGSVIKICKFLEKDLDEKAIDSVVAHSSFKSMKENKMSNWSLVPPEMMDRKTPFMRKGQSGDWKNHFTKEHIDLFDATYKEKMKGMDVKFSWDSL